MMCRWSESRTSPTVHSDLWDRGGWAKEMPGELKPPVARLGKFTAASE